MHLHLWRCGGSPSERNQFVKLGDTRSEPMTAARRIVAISKGREQTQSVLLEAPQPAIDNVDRRPRRHRFAENP